MNVQEYREVLQEDVALAANASMTTQEDEFLSLVTGILIDAEEFDDFTECYFEGVSRRKANMRIDGYSIDETDGSYWKKVYDWGCERKLLADMESSIMKLVINMEITGRIPSAKQAKVVLKLKERLIAEGMPMQF